MNLTKQNKIDISELLNYLVIKPAPISDLIEQILHEDLDNHNGPWSGDSDGKKISWRKYPRLNRVFAKMRILGLVKEVPRKKKDTSGIVVWKTVAREVRKWRKQNA